MKNKISLKNRLLDFVRTYPKGDTNGWVNGGYCERLAEQMGYKASNASRRLRELENEKKIVREIRKGERVKSVWYHSTAPKEIINYYKEGTKDLIYTKKLYD